MKTTIIYINIIICLLFFSITIQATTTVTPTTAPYYGTARYPYWGLYGPVSMTNVRAATWIKTDGVVIGWDWSLPSFVKLPKHSTFSLLRTGVSASSTTALNGLQKPSFPCKPSVAFWVSWKDLEAVQGIFTFGQLITNIRLAASKGYQSIVRIHSSTTDFAPAWVGNLGLATFVGSKVTNYDIANPIFHALYLKLVEEIGKSGIPQMPEVTGLYVGYASGSYGDEGIGPSSSIAENDANPQVRERLDAWANITKGVEYKVFMGGQSYYGQNKGFGVRRGFVEMYMNNIPSDYLGQKLDGNSYLYVDESVPEIQRNLYNGDENEEYGTDIATSAFGFRFGPTTESFNYRYFSSSIRVLQMRTNELLNHKDAVMAEMTAWVGQNLGRTVDEAPDVFSFLRETRVLSSDIKNFERWLYQRDAVGYTTVATKKIYYDNYQSTNVRSINGEAMHDKIAREGKKIGFNIDKNWTGVKDSLAIKVSLFDDNAGMINLKYSNGTEIATMTKPLLGDSLLKTYTFFVSNYKNGGNIGGKFDFTLEAGDNTKSIIVSFVRVVQAGTTHQATSIQSVANKESKITVLNNNALNVITVSSESLIKNVTIFNMQGQKVKWTSSLNNQVSISSANLVAGAYIVLVNDVLGNIERKKIIIN